MKSKWNLPRGVVFVIWGIRLWGLWRGYIVQMSGSMTNHFRTPTKHEAKDTRQTTGKPLGTREQDPKTREPPPLLGPKNQKHRYTRTPRRNENFFGDDAQNQRVFQLAASVDEQLSKASQVNFVNGFGFDFDCVISVRRRMKSLLWPFGNGKQSSGPDAWWGPTLCQQTPTGPCQP